MKEFLNNFEMAVNQIQWVQLQLCLSTLNCTWVELGNETPSIVDLLTVVEDLAIECYKDLNRYDKIDSIRKVKHGFAVALSRKHNAVSIEYTLFNGRWDDNIAALSV